MGLKPAPGPWGKTCFRPLRHFGQKRNVGENKILAWQPYLSHLSFTIADTHFEQSCIQAGSGARIRGPVARSARRDRTGDAVREGNLAGWRTVYPEAQGGLNGLHELSLRGGEDF